MKKGNKQIQTDSEGQLILPDCQCTMTQSWEVLLKI